MKELQNGVAIQTLKQNVSFQFKGGVDDSTINGTVTKQYFESNYFQVTPPFDGEWDYDVIFNALDTEKHAGMVNTDDEYTFGNDSYYKIDTDSAVEGEYFVLLNEATAIAGGTGQVLKVFAREDESTSDPTQIGLVSHFYSLAAEDYPEYIYQYGPNRFSNSFLGADESAKLYRIEEISGFKYFLQDNNTEFLRCSGGTTSSGAITISGEKTETTDWSGKIRYYVETDAAPGPGEEEEIHSEGYVYINSRVNNGPIYPTREVVGQLLTSTGVQGNPTTTAITDIDINYSVNGTDYLKKKDVAAAIENFTDVPFGLFWKVECNTPFKAWMTE